jgi:hypothetical protein
MLDGLSGLLFKFNELSRAIGVYIGMKIWCVEIKAPA